MQTNIENVKIEIRRLTIADRKLLSNLIKKLADTVGDTSLTNLISSAVTVSSEAVDNQDKKEGSTEEKKEDNAIQIGIKILKELIDTLETETHAWFADLIGVSEDAFLKLPLDTEAKIVDQIIESEEASSFFTIASRLYSKIDLLQSKFTATRGKSDLDTD